MDIDGLLEITRLIKAIKQEGRLGDIDKKKKDETREGEVIFSSGMYYVLNNFVPMQLYQTHGK